MHNNIDGLTVLGFPCNQFGAQEPGSNAEILTFAQSKYDANFPLFAKIEVNGANAAPLYNWLKSTVKDEDGKADIAWNFAKFLVNKEGKAIKRYHPRATPEDIAKTIADDF